MIANLVPRPLRNELLHSLVAEGCTITGWWRIPPEGSDYALPAPDSVTKGAPCIGCRHRRWHEAGSSVFSPGQVKLVSLAASQMILAKFDNRSAYIRIASVNRSSDQVITVVRHDSTFQRWSRIFVGGCEHRFKELGSMITGRTRSMFASP